LKSVAIWYSGQEKAAIDIHINFWKLPAQSGTFSRFLDIGLNLHTSSKINQLFLYLPFSVESDDLTDLGAVISDGSGNLLTAIFNEDYLITSTAKSDYHEVKDHAGNEIFNIYAMSKSNFSIVEKLNSEGTIIEIKLPSKAIREEKTYIRFRVSGNKMIGFSRIEKNVSSVLNSAFTKAEIFDFRINATRHLPNKLLEKINQALLFDIRKIHFFYICSYRENYILSHRPFFGARKLEDDIWNPYISTALKPLDQSSNETLIAYHWKEKADESQGIEDFNVLMKTSFRHNNWKTILAYIVFLLVFSIVANLISNYIFSKMTTEEENITTTSLEKKTDVVNKMMDRKDTQDTR
jgi:predicted cupin superfamily sugar epimerase